jgi:hypothetical protein
MAAQKKGGVSPTSVGEVLTLPRFEFEELSVRVVGTSPLVVHRMGSKALQQIGEGQGIYPKQPKKPKDPVACFLDTLYRPNASDVVVAVDERGKVLDSYTPDELIEGLWPVWAQFGDKKFDRFVFPAHAFREAMGSASMASNLTKDIVTIRRAVSVARTMLVIESDERPQMRFDVADVQGKVDLRFRAQFTEWGMRVVIRYATCMATKDTILNLLRLAGIVSGIGEMRNEKKVGTFGGFTIDPKSVTVERIAA